MGAINDTGSIHSSSYDYGGPVIPTYTQPSSQYGSTPSIPGGGGPIHNSPYAFNGSHYQSPGPTSYYDPSIQGGPASVAGSMALPSGSNTNRSRPLSYMSNFPPTLPPISSTDGKQPLDDDLLAEIRHILSTADLMTITKKAVRDDLSTLFGVDLTSRKEFINASIDGLLQGRL